MKLSQAKNGIICEGFYYEATQKDDIDSELEEALEEALIFKPEIAPEELSNIKEQERAKHLVSQIEKKHQPAINSKVEKEIQNQIGPMIDCMPDKMRKAQRKTFLLQHYYDIVEHIIKENPETFVPEIEIEMLKNDEATAKA